jgi:hypothetical protein
MKAISLWQPWAVLCVIEDARAKHFETRSWPTTFRGPLLIHAAKRCDLKVLVAIHELAGYLIPFGIHGPADLTFGALIGRVQLVACHRMRDIEPPSEHEQALGDWSPERYAWAFERPERFALPIPYRGAQGFFNVPSEALA